MKTLVIIGATGLVGSELLNQALNDSHVDKIFCISRSQLSLTHPKIKNIITDFKMLKNLKLDISNATFISCLGTTIQDAKSKEAFYQVDFGYNYQFAQLAVSHHAEQLILVSAIGASSQSQVYYSKVKGQLEDQVKKLPLPSLYILQPSLLLGSRKKIRPIEQIMQVTAPKLSWLLIGGLAKYRPISAGDLAKSILNMSLRPKSGIHTFTHDEILSFLVS